ncbi:MAG: hypothetical protein U0L56_12610, partial [Lachnospiraceae bacterium]|nr:hypothetical protein [Lachnospiraceae bacterium]
LLKKLYLTNTVVTPAEKEEISKCTGLTVHADQHTLPILVYKQKEHYEERYNCQNRHQHNKTDGV